MLEVTDLVASYGPVTALDGVSISVPAGKVTAVLGANGAGKTTLLRALSGLIPVSAGSVRLAGTDVTGSGPEKLARSGLAHVPENRLVFPSLTVEDNRVLGASTRRRQVRLELVLVVRRAERGSSSSHTAVSGRRRPTTR